MKGNNRLFNAWNSMPYQADITRAWNAKQIAAANSTKIKSLSKQVYRNRGELKVKHGTITTTTMPTATASTVELTLIQQGSDVYQREGNHIYVKGFNISGFVTEGGMDVYVVLSKNGAVPSYGQFQNRVGGFLYANDRSEFTVLATWKNTSFTNYTTGDNFIQYIRMSRRINLSTWYNGPATGNGVRNRIFLLVKNDTGATQGYQLNCELFYRDK